MIGVDSEWWKNTLYLWENQDRFAPLIDAWEIAQKKKRANQRMQLPTLVTSAAAAAAAPKPKIALA